MKRGNLFYFKIIAIIFYILFFLINIPAIAGTISGPSGFCLTSSGYTTTYTASGFTGATSYNWSVPSYATIISGQNTATITVKFSYTTASVGLIYVNTNVGSSGLNLSIYRAAGAAGIISGPSVVCAGQTNVEFSVPAISNATQYSWGAPSGASIASQSGNKVWINFSSSFTSGTVRVQGIAGACGPGVSSTKTISKAVSPATPGAISGKNLISAGETNVTYSIPAIANASNYQWTAPSGATIISGQGTRTIKVSFSSAFQSGNIIVHGLNGGCVGPSSSPFHVALSILPGTPAYISGNTPCVGSSDVLITYTVPPVVNEDPNNYIWSIGPGMIPMGNPDRGGYPFTNTMQVKFLANMPSSTWISVYNKNSKGAGGETTRNLQIYRPVGTPDPISGPSEVCQGQTDVVYSVPPILNASPHLWSLPSGVSYVSGMNTNQITVNFSETFTEGQIRVYGVNGPCGAGPSSITNVSVPAQPGDPETITGNPLVCPGAVGEVYSVPPISNATGYEWSLPSGATITAGQNTNSITVSYSESASNGNISVFGKNCDGNGATASKAIAVKAKPEAAEAIVGKTLVCPGETAIAYQVPAIANATGYLWTVPSGATIKSGQNTTKITVDFSSSTVGGNIVVKGTGCGLNGASSSLTISTSANVGTKNVAHSVDLATGIMSANIPIFNVHDGNVQVPAVLSYTAAGVRVTDDDGWVGHNWNLSVQSYKITREMRGLPDDHLKTGDSRKGWLYGSKRSAIKNFTISTDNNPVTCADEVANYDFLNSISRNEDTEPDVFHVNAPGLSFQFYFDENRQPQIMPYNDVSIIPHTVAGEFTSATATGLLTSFTVIDSKGIKYVFSETESITESLQEANDFYWVRKSYQHLVPFTYNTSWRLTSILSPVYGTVNFTYKTINPDDDALYPDWYKRTNQYKYRFANKIGNSYNASGTFAYNRASTLRILQTISSPTMEAEFISDPKNEFTAMERLSAINIYDKRQGTRALTKTISFLYNSVGQRIFLSAVQQSAQCNIIKYQFEYYTEPLPPYDSNDKDDWNFYQSAWSIPYQGKPYDETVMAGSLKKIIHPYRGYDVFFYEPHDFIEENETILGGGIRLRKSISYDGVSSDNDVIKEYEYKTADGKSSGKLQHKAIHNFSVARVDYLATGPNSFDRYDEPRFREMQTAGFNSFDRERMFTLESEEELSHYNMLQGSVIGYQRVTLIQKERGRSVFEFDLPASSGDESANNNEWKASKVFIARPAAGAYGCYETANVQQGTNQYPFPPDPNYEFAKGLLKKVTDFSEDGEKVREVAYEYQRVYGNGASIQKIYGLALEELPTYYYTGSAYVDAKMFLYSKYEMFANVKTELSNQTETIYNAANLTRKTETKTQYFYDSPHHREVSRIVKWNSDGSQTIKKIKYAKDYPMSVPDDSLSVALKSLNDAHRTTVVEVTTSKLTGGVEKFIEANLTTFQSVGGKVFPESQYKFVSPSGTTSFVEASIIGGATFQYDLNNYVLDRSFLAYDAFGNATAIKEKDRTISSVAYGYNGTLPVLNIVHAQSGELRYSDFETTTPIQFNITWGGPTYILGRNNTKGIDLPAGNSSANYLTGAVSYNNSPYYVLSFWTKANTAGSLSILVGTSNTATYTFPFDASTDWEYYSFKVPVSSIIGSSKSFYASIWSNVDMQLDDMAFYPEHSDFVAYTYEIPNGKTSETDSRGIAYFYEYDEWGRIKEVYDQNKNLIKKHDYQVRP